MNSFFENSIYQNKNIFFKRRHQLSTILLVGFFFGIIAVAGYYVKSPSDIISPILSPLMPLEPLKGEKKGYEVFGFAPYWTINKLEDVDYGTLTTLAYFGMEIDGSGDIVKDDPGYTAFQGKRATEVFKKAHASGTRVVLTITQMENDSIEELLSDKDAQENAITQSISEVKKRGIDGINVDFEYIGNPGSEKKDAFSGFVKNLTERIHREVPGSKVTVSVYASSAKPGQHKLYDISALGNDADGIFMMAYDFAVAGAENATPTAPLYGKKEGKYAYDVATAVEDFLKVMPSNKLILGVPYYGYNYLTYSPEIKAQTRPSYTWRGRPHAQTYTLAQNEITPDMDGIDGYKTGWDDVGKVSWKAYRDIETDTWRMIFLDDTKSLGIKYDFAKSKNLAGVGMWALGFDNGRTELWSVLREKFGTKYADARIVNKAINEDM